MNLAGSRYALQKDHRGRWVTVAATDDLPLLMKMLRDQHKHVPVSTSWRVLDRVHDQVLPVTQQSTRERRVQ